MCGNQSLGGLDRCLDSVTNHNSFGHPVGGTRLISTAHGCKMPSRPGWTPGPRLSHMWPRAVAAPPRPWEVGGGVLGNTETWAGPCGHQPQQGARRRQLQAGPMAGRGRRGLHGHLPGKLPQGLGAWPPRTFELRDLSGGTLGQALVAGVTCQGHRHATAAQQEADLLASCILRGRKQTGDGSASVLCQRTSRNQGQAATQMGSNPSCDPW